MFLMFSIDENDEKGEGPSWNLFFFVQKTPYNAVLGP